MTLKEWRSLAWAEKCLQGKGTLLEVIGLLEHVIGMLGRPCTLQALCQDLFREYDAEDRCTPNGPLERRYDVIPLEMVPGAVGIWDKQERDWVACWLLSNE